jgi:hypothetical protein
MLIEHSYPVQGSKTTAVVRKIIAPFSLQVT